MMGMMMGKVMVEGGGTVKKMKMKMAEGDTCDEVVENRFFGGHSTFNILFSGRMNIQL